MNEELQKLMDELDRIHPMGNLDAKTLDANTIPTIQKSVNGIQRCFTKAALLSVRRISDNIYASQPHYKITLKKEKFFSLVLQSVTDLHTVVPTSKGNIGTSLLADLNNLIDNRFKNLTKDFTIYFSARTLNIEQTRNFSVGPVIFQTRETWIKKVDFSKQAKEEIDKTEKKDWKKRTLSSLKKRNPKKITGLSSYIYPAIKNSPSILEVSTSGFEQQQSKVLAKVACKAALDSLSLCAEDPGLPFQLLLQEDRSFSVEKFSLLAINNSLFLPGSSFRPGIFPPSEELVDDILLNCQPLLDACGAAIAAILDASTHPAPKLAGRWITALNWFGEGCREEDDAIALTKIASCLDILACGGKYAGILAMLCHLSQKAADTLIISYPPLTLANLVKKVYDQGRSQILHGSRYDRLEEHSEERGYANLLARFALQECILRWHRYTGLDDAKAFRSIPP